MEFCQSISWFFFYAVAAIVFCLFWHILFFARYDDVFRRFRGPTLTEYFNKFKNTRIMLESSGEAINTHSLIIKLDSKKPDDELVQRLFSIRGAWRRQTFLLSGPKGRDHALAELTELRQEIADIKQRETSSERFISGAVAAVALAYFHELFEKTEIVAIALVSLGFSVFGYWRFREYQRNNFEIDCYLREIEVAFDRRGGWVDFFFTGRSPIRYFQSRVGFWWLLILVSYGTLVFSFAELICLTTPFNSSGWLERFLRP